MTEYRFHCTGCGRCCTAAPETTVTEALGLYRDFVLMLKIGGAADLEQLPLDTQMKARREGLDLRTFRNQFNHLASMGAVVVRASGVRIAIRLSATTLSSPALGRCPKLGADGLCTIHDRRPALCRSLPLDYWSGEGEQPLRIAIMAERTKAGVYQCDMGADAPPLWRDGAICDGPYRTAYQDGIARSKEDWPILSVLRAEMEAGNPGLPNLTQVGGAILAGEGYQLDFLGVLMTLHVFRRANLQETTLDLAGLPEVEDFLTVQLDLIRAQLADNLRRKAAADRPVTEKLRALERHYADALRARVWEDEDAA